MTLGPLPPPWVFGSCFVSPHVPGLLLLLQKGDQVWLRGKKSYLLEETESGWGFSNLQWSVVYYMKVTREDIVGYLNILGCDFPKHCSLTAPLLLLGQWTFQILSSTPKYDWVRNKVGKLDVRAEATLCDTTEFLELPVSLSKGFRLPQERWSLKLWWNITKSSFSMPTNSQYVPESRDLKLCRRKLKLPGGFTDNGAKTQTVDLATEARFL